MNNSEDGMPPERMDVMFGQNADYQLETGWKAGECS